jgi:hypothetical protein
MGVTTQAQIIVWDYETEPIVNIIRLTNGHPTGEHAVVTELKPFIETIIAANLNGFYNGPRLAGYLAAEYFTEINHEEYSLLSSHHVDSQTRFFYVVSPNGITVYNADRDIATVTDLLEATPLFHSSHVNEEEVRKTEKECEVLRKQIADKEAYLVRLKKRQPKVR